MLALDPAKAGQKMPTTPGFKGISTMGNDVSVTNSVTFVSTGLTIPAYNQGGTGTVNMKFRAVLFWQQFGVGGIRYRWQGVVLNCMFSKKQFDIDGAALSFGLITSSTAQNTFVPAGGSQQFIEVEGIARISGSPDLQFAQAVADPNATTVYSQGSYLEFHIF